MDKPNLLAGLPQPDEIAANKPSDPLQWIEEYIVSPEEIAEIKDAKFIIPNFIISSQITVIAALPGKGKTTIMMHECASMVARGYRVLYVNMDCGAGDLSYWAGLAAKGGFSVATPHMKGAGGVSAWMEGLAKMTVAEGDMSNVVIVVDTLKKIADLLQKNRVREVFNMLRALTGKSITVICIGHCNKHRDDTGGLVFEGTGDVMSDCDNMLYLDSDKDERGVRTVTVTPTDKVRGIFEPRSWIINKDRSVEALDHFEDVTQKIAERQRLEKDEPAIEAITGGIQSGKHLRLELKAYCESEGVGKRAFDRVIKHYCKGKGDGQPLWRNEKQIKDNASFYILLEPAPCTDATT